MAYDFHILAKQVKLLFSIIFKALHRICNHPTTIPGSIYVLLAREEGIVVVPLLMCLLESLHLTVVDKNLKSIISYTCM